MKLHVTITEEERQALEQKFREFQETPDLDLSQAKSVQGDKSNPAQRELQGAIAHLARRYGFDPATARINVTETEFESTPNPRLMAQTISLTANLISLWAEGKADALTEALVLNGFLSPVAYDPEVHGDLAGDPAPGDTIYRLSRTGETVMQSTKLRKNGVDPLM